LKSDSEIVRNKLQKRRDAYKTKREELPKCENPKCNCRGNWKEINDLGYCGRCWNNLNRSTKANREREAYKTLRLQSCLTDTYENEVGERALVEERDEILQGFQKLIGGLDNQHEKKATEVQNKLNQILHHIKLPVPKKGVA